MQTRIVFTQSRHCSLSVLSVHSCCSVRIYLSVLSSLSGTNSNNAIRQTGVNLIVQSALICAANGLLIPACDEIQSVCDSPYGNFGNTFVYLVDG